jgi:hypothetical protein
LTFAAFAGEAGALLDAVVSAIEAVESVDGLEVLGVEPDELVWASEIAARTGRSRQSVDQLVKGQRGPGGFPPTQCDSLIPGRRAFLTSSHPSVIGSHS